MILNVIDAKAYNSMLLENPPSQEKLQEWFQETIREYLEECYPEFPDVDFSLPTKQWVAQIPDKFKFKVPRGTKILSAGYGEEDGINGDFSGTELEKDSSGLIGIDGRWCTHPEFELIIDDDETFVINPDATPSLDEMFTTSGDAVWLIDKNGNLCIFGDEPWGNTKEENDKEINPSLLDLYDCVVKHN